MHLSERLTYNHTIFVRLEYAVHYVYVRRAGDALQKVVDDDPLVVPAHDLAGLIEPLIVTQASEQGIVCNFVVKVKKSQMELGHDQVFIIARITDERASR